MVFQSRKNMVKSLLILKDHNLVPRKKLKKSEAIFCTTTLLLSFCETVCGISQLIKKLIDGVKMPFFDIFASPRWSPLRMRPKVVSFFILFESFQTNGCQFFYLCRSWKRRVWLGMIRQERVYDWMDLNPASFRWSLRAGRLGQSGSPRSGKELTAWWKSKFTTQFPLWLRSSVVRACD